MNTYFPRVMDKVLDEELQAFGAVLLAGPKWCGKTTTAKRIAKSVLNMQSPDEQENYLQLAQIKPSLLLEGDSPRLIDEWQVAPQLWDAVRQDVDRRAQTGLYILTGSTSVDEKQIKHSGAGRIARLKMYTMSLFESQDATGEVSLAALFDSPKDLAAHSQTTIEDYARLIVRGGWPGMLGKSPEANRRQMAGYCDALITSDIQTVDGVSRDERRAFALLRSYARHTATAASKTTILSDVNANNQSMHMNTLDNYLEAFNRLFVIDDLPAWSPRLRSKATIRTSETRHFVDPAIAAFFLQAGTSDLMYDLNTFGFLFESLVVRDLRVYAQALGGKVAHYKDNSGLEADAIIHLPDGRWVAVEVKLGSAQLDEAAKNLRALKEKVDTDHMRAPAALIIITGSAYAYQRQDGVYVVPLACLGP